MYIYVCKNTYTHTNIHVYIICDRSLIVLISLVMCLGFWTTWTRMNLPFNLTGKKDHSLQLWTAKQCLVPSHSVD